MIKFEINKKEGSINPRVVLNKLSKIVSKDFKDNGVISIVILGDKEIKKLNNNYRGKNKATDILTFVINDKGEFGEIILGYGKLKERSKKMKTTLLATSLYLIIHGICHILGFDHSVDVNANKMEKKEDDYLIKMGYKLDRESGYLSKK